MHIYSSKIGLDSQEENTRYTAAFPKPPLHLVLVAFQEMLLLYLVFYIKLIKFYLITEAYITYNSCLILSYKSFGKYAFTKIPSA